MTGQLSAFHFREGQDVRKGQPLFTLDPRPFQAALQQAEAVLARDTAQAKNAQSQQARYEDLFNRGLIPRDQYETQTANASALEATLAADQRADRKRPAQPPLHPHRRADFGPDRRTGACTPAIWFAPTTRRRWW